MQKKIFLQLFLLICAIVISIFFFRTYFLNNDTKTIKTEKNNLDFENRSDSNLISNIKYVSEDKNGNIYQINSEYAEIKDDQLELVFMKNVVGVIRLNNSTPINISSERAIYNKITYDTNFYTNVLLTNDDHIITSDILDLFFGKVFDKTNLSTLGFESSTLAPFGAAERSAHSVIPNQARRAKKRTSSIIVIVFAQFIFVFYSQ